MSVSIYDLIDFPLEEAPEEEKYIWKEYEEKIHPLKDLEDTSKGFYAEVRAVDFTIEFCEKYEEKFPGLMKKYAIVEFNPLIFYAYSKLRQGKTTKEKFINAIKLIRTDED